MNRRALYKRLLASETRWFGGVRDAPKVFDTLTRNHIDPVAAQAVTSGQADSLQPGDAYYEMIVEVETGDLTFGPVTRE